MKQSDIDEPEKLFHLIIFLSQNTKHLDDVFILFHSILPHILIQEVLELTYILLDCIKPDKLSNGWISIRLAQPSSLCSSPELQELVYAFKHLYTRLVFVLFTKSQTEYDVEVAQFSKSAGISSLKYQAFDISVECSWFTNLQLKSARQSMYNV